MMGGLVVVYCVVLFVDSFVVVVVVVNAVKASTAMAKDDSAC